MTANCTVRNTLRDPNIFLRGSIGFCALALPREAEETQSWYIWSRSFLNASQMKRYCVNVLSSSFSELISHFAKPQKKRKNLSSTSNALRRLITFPFNLNTVAIPKSLILRLSWSSNNRFSGFRSRCATPQQWRYSCQQHTTSTNYISQNKIRRHSSLKNHHAPGNWKQSFNVLRRNLLKDRTNLNNTFKMWFIITILQPH